MKVTISTMKTLGSLKREASYLHYLLHNSVMHEIEPN